MSTPPQYIQDLLDIIQKMSNKIDNLENKIDEIRQQFQRGGGSGIKRGAVAVVPDFTPHIEFQKWIQSFDIGKQDVDILLSTNILDGFKSCIIKYFGEEVANIEDKPIWISSNGRYKQIYIYDILDCLDQDAQWRIMTEDDVYLLIEILWCKMLHYYFVTEEESIADTLSDNEQIQRDINKKVLLDMKKRLQKHTKEIQRCIVDTLG